LDLCPLLVGRVLVWLFSWSLVLTWNAHQSAVYVVPSGRLEPLTLDALKLSFGYGEVSPGDADCTVAGEVQFDQGLYRVVVFVAVDLDYVRHRLILLKKVVNADR
jgi:hypothetical protein